MKTAKIPAMITVLLALCAGAAFAQANAALSSCISAGQAAFNKNNIDEAEAQFRRCIAAWPSDANSHISLAGVLMTKGNLTDAKDEFNVGLSLINSASPTAAYCQSRLGDIAIKQGKYDEAETKYILAIAADHYEVNAIIGLGRCRELKKDWKSAAENYRRAYALEPANPVARQGLRRVEPNVMTDEEILAELKLRRALPPDVGALSEEKKALFMEMRQAEEYDAVTYLFKKVRPMRPNYVVEKDTGTINYRLMFTARGFYAYKTYISSDALRFFEKKGMPLKQIVKLRTKNGGLVFDPAAGGRLSSEGMKAYFYAVLGQKIYLLPSEPLSFEDAAIVEEKDRLEGEMKRDRYMEISELEYLWLLRATDCSEEALTDALDMRIREIPVPGTERKSKRYFVDTTGNMKDRGALASHVYRYRSGDTDTSGAGSTGFFGTGGMQKQKLCGKNGSVFSGEL